ncbi:MAG: long-chain acyl-CoA synthetase [Candidatus Poriferisodalaceae bacterium]|jgi:long-chain acyl-CoA synthetase
MVAEPHSRPQLYSTVADIIRDHASTRPNSSALTFSPDHERSGTSTVVYSYADLHRRSSQAANALAEAGVAAGDRVAILAQNSPKFYELAFAVSKIGAVLVGLNWRLAPPEIEAIVADAEPTLMIVDRDLDHMVTDATRADLGAAIVDEVAWDLAVTDASSGDPQRDGGPDAVVFILYTSGTTGLPKGAQLTNHNMAHSAWISGLAYGVTGESTNLVAMPLFHVGGMGYGLSAFFHGGHTVLRQLPEPVGLVADLAEYRVTHAFFVPAVIQAMLDVDGVDTADMSALELLVYGAAPIGDSVLRKALRIFGCNFMQAYGMTETAGSIVTLAPEDHDPDGPRAGLLRSCGKPLPWVEVRLVDPKSLASGTPTDVAVGEVGEIWTRSGQNIPGYRNRSEATAEAITADGWLRTGDAAYANDEGHLFLFDRFKDMIVSGAENVYPAEAENVLYDHPDVTEVAVIGVPDDRWGETVKAIVVARPGTEIGTDALIELCRSRLARFKCPTSFDFVDELPRNASGKVLKTALRAPYWEGHDRAIG